MGKIQYWTNLYSALSATHKTEKSLSSKLHEYVLSNADLANSLQNQCLQQGACQVC